MPIIYHYIGIKEVTRMKITKEVIACWIIGAILVFFGTSVESYVFETLAVVIIAFGAILAIFWDDFFKTNKQEQIKKKEEE
jgi:UDP-N-acetylmuramyl pentapeptide phosphotransferase/UDP-N-acetylglucosamine-1-phosphate transferase